MHLTGEATDCFFKADRANGRKAEKLHQTMTGDVEETPYSLP